MYKESLLLPRQIQEIEAETAFSRRRRERHNGRFVRGPLPLNQVMAAARLPGKALAVWLAVHHRTALTGKQMVTLPESLLAGFGIGKDAKARALQQLEQAGLVRVERESGRTTRVGLLPAATEPTEARGGN